MFIKSENVKRNGKRIWGTFILSDKTKTHFEMLKNEAWFQWGNSTNNLCVTVDRVEQLCQEWAEQHI